VPIFRDLDSKNDYAKKEKNIKVIKAIKVIKVL
jgi:hypothetical protein